ncbi:MAG: heavy metal translocating P-type ATPase [Minisyncoccales bacterium]
MVSKELKIGGIDCASCVAKIEKEVSSKEGISSVSVNLATSKAFINFNSDKISLDEIEKTITDLGYSIEKNEDIFSSIDKEVLSLRNRFLASLILGLPVIIIAVNGLFKLSLFKLSFFSEAILQFIIATLIMVINKDLYMKGFKNIIKRSPSMDSLIEIGTVAAYLYSLFIFIFVLLGKSSTQPIYFESAVMILIFVSLGKYLEGMAKGKTSDALRKLIDLKPKEALMVINGIEKRIPVSEIKINDIVLIKPGDIIPVDGIVIEGFSSVDEKTITGESNLSDKTIGDTVIGATLNKTGSLLVKVSRVGPETTISKIIKTVESALNSKAPIQLLADKVSFYFIPTVFSIGLLSAVIWLLLGQSLVFAVTVFISVLIISCPCTLGLAIPTAIMVGAGMGAQRGILIKNGKALELINKSNIIVFDKTGTLTLGHPKVNTIFTKNNNDKEIIQLAASVEKGSEHPLAEAVLNKAKEEGIDLLKVDKFEAFPGGGVSATINGKNVLLGTRKLMSNINVSFFEERMTQLEEEGNTVILVSVDNEAVGIISLLDELKENAVSVIKKLKKYGKRIFMITGDNKRVAKSISQKLEIDEFLSEVLPHEKAEKIKELQKEGNIVSMVGDGINDAPALAQSDAGIVLGSGADIAIETGDIILIKDDLENVVRAINLSKGVFRKIKENLFWSFFYNCIGIIFATGLLYSYTHWLLNPALAALAMALSSVSVVLNSLILKRYKF